MRTLTRISSRTHRARQINLEQLEDRTTPTLVASYGFNEGANSTLVDLSAHGNTGTISGATWTDAGKFGNALSFDGVNDRVNIADSASLDLTNGMTLEAWVYPTAMNSWETVLLKEASGDLAYALYADNNAEQNNGQHAPGSWIRQGGTTSQAVGASQIPLNTWTHLAATFNGAVLQMYVNGQPAGSVERTIPINATNKLLRIGGNSIWNEWFNGRIDEVRIYNQALTQIEIQEDMNAPVLPDTTPPTVTSTFPAAAATGVSTSGDITITFSEGMDATTINASTIELRDSSNAVVPATVVYEDANAYTATVTPSTMLSIASNYSVAVRGGTAGSAVADRSGNRLATNFTLSFTTAPVVQSAPENVFAKFVGVVSSATTPAIVPIHIGPDNFTITHGAGDPEGVHGVFGFVVSPQPGSGLSPRGVTIENTVPGADGTVDPNRGVHVMKTRTQLPDGSSLVLVELTHGNYNVKIRGRDGTTGAWTLTTILIGDVNGDFLVNDTDIALLHDYQHGNNTNPAVLAAGDADRSGRIRDYDLNLASSNVGTTTPIRVLGVTTGLDPASDTGVLGDKLVNTPSVQISGIARPGAQITLDQDGDGFDDGTTTAGATGAYSNTAALVEGGNLLGVRARDSFGQQAIASTVVSLDTHLTSPALDLSVGSDTGAIADHITTAGKVTLVGQTDPGETVALLKAGSTIATALASNTGRFIFANISLAMGNNVLTARVEDIAGNVRTFGLTLTRVAPDPNQIDVVMRWNQATLDAIRLDASAPPVASRSLAMVNTAIFDSVSTIEGTPGYLVKLPAPAGASAEAAAAAAAHTVLSYLYPGQQASVDAALTASLAQVPDGPAKTAGVTFGQAVGNAVVALRANDGARQFTDYVSAGGPGGWQPTTPMYAEALLPNWAGVEPFAISSTDQFLPAAPPALGSAEYASALNEVKSKGSATGSTRTADETNSALFWADGAGTVTPPGHWNQVAMQLAAAEGYSLSANARLFAQLNVALADSAIASWDAKYHYELWRPVTAIREADTDGNSATTLDEAWTPLLVTPNFPSYTSGHSTFSGAAQVVLESFFGTATPFTLPTEAPGIAPRTFASFQQAAEEAGQSRILGGIHYQFDNQAGLAAGRGIANVVLQAFALNTDTRAPTVSIQSPAADLVTATNQTVHGQVLDNLSGVASFEVQIDGGSFGPVTFDASGNFTVGTAFPLNGSADGTHTLGFRATDFAGNVSTAQTHSFTLDTQAPAVSLTAPLANGTLTAASRLTGTVSGTGSNVTALSYSFDGGMSFSMIFDPASGAFDQPLDPSPLATGGHTLTVTARDAAGNTTTTTRNVSQPNAIGLALIGSTPTDGAEDVGSTQRPKVTFSRPIDKTTLSSVNFFATDSTGTKLSANIVVSDDNTFAWLFFTNPMPGGSTITVTVDGATIRAADGSQLDAARTGTPGSKLIYRFSTVSLAGLFGTSLTGIVADPGADLKPNTVDDVRRGPDGVLMTGDDVYVNPIAHVKVYLLGLESQAVFTDAQGRFTLTSVPTGHVKLVLEGPTATGAPAGCYFPEMVMDLNLEPSQVNTVMGSMGTPEQTAASETVQGVYLPRLKTSILQPVSETDVTHIGVNADSAPNLTPDQRQVMTIDVQPGSLIGPDGQRLTTAQIGISTVPEELVRDMLPPGVLQHTFDITVQAPGIATFSKPAPMTFPNVFNAEPGSKLDFLSFDHTTGMLVIEGTATVSADGLTVTTDPGTGITHPGWHGLTPPGGCGGSGGPPPQGPTPVQPGEVVTEHDPVALSFITGNSGGSGLSRSWTAPPENPNVPSLPPIPGCEVPPHTSNDPQQPFTNVTIEVDGPLAQFMKPTGSSLPLVGQSFTLSPGTGDTKTFAFQSKTYDEIFGAGGFSALNRDQLYGSKIKVTVIKQLSNGSRTRDIYRYYQYRWVTVIDAEQAKNKAGNTAAFHRTLTDGFERTKNVDLDLPVSVPTHFDGPIISSPFDLSGNYNGKTTAVWKFDPFFSGERSDTFDLEVDDPNESDLDVGQIIAKGRATNATKIDINLGGFRTELRRVIQAIQRLDGPDAMPNTADDILQYTRTDTNVWTVGPRYKVEFAGFLPGDTYTNAQLDARIELEATRIQAAVENDYNAVNTAGGATGYTFGTFFADVTMTWADETTYGVGGAADYDSDEAFLRPIVTNTTIGEAAKEWALAEALNKKVSNSGHFAISDHLNWTMGITLAQKVANIVNHEVGHTFGLNDAYSKVGGVHAVNPMPDNMNSYSPSDGDFNFGTNNTMLLQAALGILPNGDRPLTAALKMYRDNINLPDNDTGIIEMSDPNRSTPELALLQGGVALLPGDSGQFGRIVADGAGGESRSLDYVLYNPGLAPLTIGTVNLAAGNRGFSVVTSGLNGAVVAPGASLTLTLVYDPLVAGSHADTLVIASNADVSPSFALLLAGSATPMNPTAHLAVLANNNLGGAAVTTGTASRPDLATITNDGSQPLVISSIFLAAGGGNFALTGVPTDLATNPIVLATGESFIFGANFTPGSVGLHRALINVVTNDPARPTIRLSAVGTGLAELPTAAWSRDYVALEMPNRPGAQPLHATSDANGNFSFFLPPTQAYHLVMFDPTTGLVSRGYGTTARSGQGVDLTKDLVFGASTAPDTDFDGLPDDVEFAIGTAKGKADTDSDGLDDFTEVSQGLDPRGGHAFPTGVIASLPLQGQAREVIAQGSLADPNGQTLYVATGSYGLAVVNATQFGKPILLGQLDLPGTNTDVAFDSDHNLAVVAAGSSGLHLVDVSNPATPALQRTIALAGGAQCVEVYDGLAYVGSGANVVSIDLATGQVLQTLALGGGTISDLAREGTMLYSMTTSRVLRATDIGGFSMVARGSLTLSSGGGKVFVGNGIAYVGAGNGDQEGFSTVNVSNPASLALLAGVQLNTVGGQAVVANGSGLALAIGTPFLGSGSNSQYVPLVNVMSVTNPAITGSLLTQFNMPASPFGLTIASGIGYVADGTSGLQVVNFVPFDVNGVSPTVSITTSAPDADTGTPGLQVVEGATLPVRVSITDDVQVRNVELLVNGQVVSNDLSFPFDFSAIAPSIAASGSGFTIQVRATDTGGNVGLSNVLTVGLVSDTVAPTIVSFVPPTNSSQIEPIQVVQVRFSEPMAADTVTSNTIRVRDAAGTFLTPTDFQLRVNDQLAQLTFPALLVGSYQIVVSGSVTDRAGNILSATDVISAFTLTPRASLATTVADADPGTPGLQVFEGTTLPLTVTVAAGVSVQKVELLVNGEIVATDTAAPYQFSFIAPNIVLGASTLTLQAKVTDTAGLATFTSPPLDVGLLEDVTPPTIVSTDPANNGVAYQGRQTLTLSFSEGLAAASAAPANFQLVEAGPGGVFGDGNDVIVAITSAQLQNVDTQIVLSTPGLTVGTYQLSVSQAGLIDRAGNPLGGGTSTVQFSVQIPLGVVLVADNGTRRVTAIEPATGSVRGSVSIPGGSAVGDVAVSLDGRFGFVTNFGNQVWVIDLTGGVPVLAAGINPISISNPGEDIALTPDGQYLVISDGSGTSPLSVVSIALRAQVSTLSLGQDFTSVDVGADGTVLATSYNFSTVRRLTINSTGVLTNTGEVLSIGGGGMNTYVVPGGQFGVSLGYGSGEVRSFRVPGLTTVSTRNLPNNPIAAAVSPTSDRVYVRSISAVYAYTLDPTTGVLGSTPLYTVALGSINSFFGMDQIAVSPDGGRLYVSNGATIRVLDAATGAVLTTITNSAFSQPTGIYYSAAGGQPQYFAGPALGAAAAPVLARDELQPAIDQAVANLAAAGYNTGTLVGVQFHVSDLPGALLGWTSGNDIMIDPTAAGYGWHTNVSPTSNVAFGPAAGTNEALALPGSPASERVDLLTVVTHELGHVLGFASIDPVVLDHDWMTATLGLGVRRAPNPVSQNGTISNHANAVVIQPRASLIETAPQPPISSTPSLSEILEAISVPLAPIDLTGVSLAGNPELFVRFEQFPVGNAARDVPEVISGNWLVPVKPDLDRFGDPVVEIPGTSLLGAAAGDHLFEVSELSV